MEVCYGCCQILHIFQIGIVVNCWCELTVRNLCGDVDQCQSYDRIELRNLLMGLCVLAMLTNELVSKLPLWRECRMKYHKSCDSRQRAPNCLQVYILSILVECDMTSVEFNEC